MRFVISFLTLALFCGATAVCANSPDTQSSPQVSGGWSSAKVDIDVQKSARFAIRKMKRGNAKIQSIDAVQQQVVAGINHRIDMTLSDRSRWRVIVWQRLDGNYRLTSTRRLSNVAQSQQFKITGRATYREFMALPAGSVVIVKLLDVSRADVVAITLAEQRIVTNGKQVPFPFSLMVAKDKLHKSIANTISIRIESDRGELLWITDANHPVEPADDATTLDMGEFVLVKT
jgi:putative lipoprotein